MTNAQKFWTTIGIIFFISSLIANFEVTISVVLFLIFIYIFISLFSYDREDEEFSVFGKYNFVNMIVKFNNFLNNERKN